MVFCGKKNENLLKKKWKYMDCGKKIYLWKIKQKLIELWKKTDMWRKKGNCGKIK